MQMKGDMITCIPGSFFQLVPAVLICNELIYQGSTMEQNLLLRSGECIGSVRRKIGAKLLEGCSIASSDLGRSC